MPYRIAANQQGLVKYTRPLVRRLIRKYRIKILTAFRGKLHRARCFNCNSGMVVSSKYTYGHSHGMSWPIWYNKKDIEKPFRGLKITEQHYLCTNCGMISKYGPDWLGPK